MIELRGDHVVETLVGNLLPAGSEKGLYIRLRTTLSNYKAVRNQDGKVVPYKGPDGDNGDPVEVTRYFHLLFLRPTNYTKVWAHTGTHHMPEPEQWQMTSYHDSCWRTDGLRVLFQGWAEMRDEIVPEGVFQVPSQFSIVEQVKFVTIEDAKVKGDLHRHMVVSVKG